MNRLLLPLLLLLLSTSLYANTAQHMQSLKLIHEKKNLELASKTKEKEQQLTALEQSNDSCEKKNAKACIEHGYLLIKEKDYTLAMDSFKKAFFLGDEDAGLRGKFYVKCLEKDPEGCYLLGYMAENGKGGEQNSTLATKAYAFNLEK